MVITRLSPCLCAFVRALKTRASVPFVYCLVKLKIAVLRVKYFGVNAGALYYPLAFLYFLMLNIVI